MHRTYLNYKEPEKNIFYILGITFFSKVTVDLNQEVVSDRCSSKEEATEAAYKVLSERFHICAPVEGKVRKF